jgi:hypothetical protein
MSQIGQRGVGFGVGVGVDGRLFSLFILFGGPGLVGVESCTVLSLWRAARENLGKIGSMPASALRNSQSDRRGPGQPVNIVARLRGRKTFLNDHQAGKHSELPHARR